MADVKITSDGDFRKTMKFLKGITDQQYMQVLDRFGKEGVRALSSATPVDTGKTAATWRYEIHKNSKNVEIVWTNDNKTNRGDNIALMLQYGHGTGTGGYVVGRDYINPAIRPIFDDMINQIWKAVESL